MKALSILVLVLAFQGNPAEWHYAMASLIWVALNEVCTPTSK
jgi:hypothetical protein